MGRPFGEKLARGFAPSVAQVLADQKANIRAGGITTLTAMADAGGLEHLVPSFDKPLDANNPLQRKELLGWLEERFKDEEAVSGLDLTGLTSPVLSCLEDRNAEVRKSATALLPVIISKAGYGYVMDAVQKLKPASRSTVLPIVEAARSSAVSSVPAQSTRPTSTAPPSSSARPTSSVPPKLQPSSSAPPPPTAPPATRAPSGGLRPTSKPLRSAAPSPYDEPPSAPPSAVPPRLAQPRPRASISGLRAVASTSRAPSTTSSSSPTSGREPPFRSSDPNPKVLRHRKETGSMRWAIEGTPRADQVEWLSSQMASQISATLHAQLFSTDHSAERDFVAGLTAMDECAKDPMAAEQFDLDGDEMRDRIIANLDLIIKYITLRIGMTSTTITVKCLDLIDHFMPLLVQSGYKMSDYEANPLLTCLISKVRSHCFLVASTLADKLLYRLEMGKKRFDNEFERSSNRFVQSTRSVRSSQRSSNKVSTTRMLEYEVNASKNSVNSTLDTESVSTLPLKLFPRSLLSSANPMRLLELPLYTLSEPSTPLLDPTRLGRQSELSLRRIVRCSRSD